MSPKPICTVTTYPANRFGEMERIGRMTVLFNCTAGTVSVKRAKPAEMSPLRCFYGGIAGGVLLIGVAGGTSANLTGYLFGSISTVTALDVWLTAGLAVLILGIGLGLRPALFALSHDEEFARATGLPIRTLNILVAVLAALTVSVSMRVVGVLLVSALMIVPVAIAQLTARSFRATMGTAMAIGAVTCVTGLSITYFHRLSPGATIAVLAIGVYAAVAIIRPLIRRPGRNTDPHLDAEDDIRLREEA